VTRLLHLAARTIDADVRRAFRYAWMVCSAIGALTVSLSLISPEAILSLIPACPSRLAGGACPLCGMTTAFVLLGRGRIAEAFQVSAGSPFLYAFFVINSAAALAAALYNRRASW
jgi:hypothetical protein